MIQIRFEKENTRAAAYDGTARIGVCTIKQMAAGWEIPHTEVDPAYGGQGIARKLVLCVAEQAEKEGVRIFPTCSYAKKVLLEE